MCNDTKSAIKSKGKTFVWSWKLAKYHLGLKFIRINCNLSHNISQDIALIHRTYMFYIELDLNHSNSYTYPNNVIPLTPCIFHIIFSIAGSTSKAATRNIPPINSTTRPSKCCRWNPISTAILWTWQVTAILLWVSHVTDIIFCLGSSSDALIRPILLLSSGNGNAVKSIICWCLFTGFKMVHYEKIRLKLISTVLYLQAQDTRLLCMDR